MAIKIPIRRETAGKTKNWQKTVNLKNAEGPECFWFNNGPIVKNLVELMEAVKAMDNNKFKYHALGNNNDFAAWIEFVLNEPALAKRIKKLRTKKSFIKAIKESLE
jgi:hypothetical protein